MFMVERILGLSPVTLLSRDKACEGGESPCCDCWHVKVILAGPNTAAAMA